MGRFETADLESVRVTKALRNDIMLGRRAPGSRLVERDIAAELNVSRLPVREAIKALVAEGVVVSRPRSWAVVREFTEQDVQDFAEVRLAMETLAFTLAAQRITEEGIAVLRNLVDREEEALQAGDLDVARNAAAYFHMQAVNYSGNTMLVEMAGALVTRLRWLFGQHDELAHMAITHRLLLDALIRADVEELRRLLAEHMADGREATVRRLKDEVESES